jgi:hypothetical protein
MTLIKDNLTDMPNIVSTLAEKLKIVCISTPGKFRTFIDNEDISSVISTLSLP